MNSYLEDSGRTVSENFYSDLVDANRLGDEVHKRISDETLDKLKKSLFYGKNEWTKGKPAYDYTYDRIDPKLIHGLLGIDSESQELMHVLHSMMLKMSNPKEVKAKLTDEIGDLLWYVALTLRTLDLTFEEVMEKNLAKLKVRYPEKFDERLALNRNDGEEAQVFVL